MGGGNKIYLRIQIALRYYKPSLRTFEQPREELLIVDNSHKHKGHKFFTPDKFHLHLKIKSLYLKSLSRVSAQKLVMKILKKDLKTKIHALEISIEQ